MDCSSATCLRNRSVKALATAPLVQAIREAQEPRMLQEISIAANLPQKEIGKYIKIPVTSSSSPLVQFVQPAKISPGVVDKQPMQHNLYEKFS